MPECYSASDSRTMFQLVVQNGEHPRQIGPVPALISQPCMPYGRQLPPKASFVKEGKQSHSGQRQCLSDGLPEGLPEMLQYLDCHLGRRCTRPPSLAHISATRHSRLWKTSYPRTAVKVTTPSGRTGRASLPIQTSHVQTKDWLD